MEESEKTQPSPLVYNYIGQALGGICVILVEESSKIEDNIRRNMTT